MSLPRFNGPDMDVTSDSWRIRQGAWAVEIRDKLSNGDLTLKAVGQRAGISEGTVRNWFLGRTRVDPAGAYKVAEIVGADPLAMAEVLGFIPPGSSQAAIGNLAKKAEIRRLEREQLKLRSLLGHELSELLAITSSSTEFSLEIRPTAEGIGNYRLQDALYSVIIRALASADGAEPFESEFFLNRLAPALSALGAAEQQSPSSWPTDVQSLRDVYPQLRVWLIPRLNALRSASDNPIIDDPTSIVVIGSHFSTWATDVASVLAQTIGFGSANTNLLTRQTFGHEVMLKPERGRLRETVAKKLLTEPDGIADHLVWAHTEGTSLTAVYDFLASGRGSPYFVFLRCTDRLHDYIVHRKNRSLDMEALTSIRANLDTAVAQSKCRTLTLNVGFPIDFTPEVQITPELRNHFLLRSMVLAHQIAAELIPAGKPFHTDCPDPIVILRDFYRAEARKFE